MGKKKSILDMMNQSLAGLSSGARGGSGALAGSAFGLAAGATAQGMTKAQLLAARAALAKQPSGTAPYSMGTKEPTPAEVKRAKLRQLPGPLRWYNQFIGALDAILEKKELSIEQLEWVPSFVRSLAEIVDFGGRRKAYEGYKNSFWRCIHRVDSLIFQDHEFMKQLRQMLCEARQMQHPDVGKTWEELEQEEEGRKDESELHDPNYEAMAKDMMRL